jgi:hypothetical protein
MEARFTAACQPPTDPSATGVDHDEVDLRHVAPDQHESDTPPFDEFRGDQP